MENQTGMTLSRSQQMTRAAVVVFALLHLPAAAPAGESLRAGNGPSAPLQARRDSLRVGDEAPPFVMRDLLTDEANYLRDYTGRTLRDAWKKKDRHVVVISFWATWCQPCKTEIPILAKLAEELKDQPVKFFLVNTMEDSNTTEDSVRIVFRNRGYSLPCLIDPSQRFQSLYTVRGLPMLVVVDKYGIVRKVNRGYHENFDIELRTLIRGLLTEDAPVGAK
jgi:thiol-disulfide isomerase/thioredoxin